VQDSLSLLMPLYEAHPQNVRLRFFHTPLLSGLLKRVLPERAAEIAGVQHIKAYLFDDDLIMSG
jgi:CDP-diacylglycerol--glycerol-3-phosphate 3-phosphatidyltransferase